MAIHMLIFGACVQLMSRGEAAIAGQLRDDTTSSTTARSSSSTGTKS